MHYKDEMLRYRDEQDLPLDDDDMFEWVINNHPRGIKSHEVAIYMGYHWKDWAAVNKLAHTYNKLNKGNGMSIIIRQLNKGGSWLIRSDYYKVEYQYYSDMKKLIGKAVNSGELVLPGKMKKAHEEYCQELKEKRLMKEAEAQREREHKEQQYVERVRSIKKGMQLETFTVIELARWLNITGNGARAHINRWLKRELVKLVVKGEPGRGSATRYKWTLPK